MRTFKSLDVPTDPAAASGFLRTLQNAIEQASTRADDRIALTYLAVLPSKPQDGLYLSAAGVLGASRGLYRYDSTTGLYTFIA